MYDEDVIASIRDSVRIGIYEYDHAKCARHQAEEGFAPEDAKYAVLHGEVIEHARGRFLFCGSVPSLRQRTGFHGRWLHVVVEYDEETGVIFVTMYRPHIREWRTERVR
jgi:hypothetical protein